MLLWCIFIEASGSVWLDVYRFPQDVWIKELETKQVIAIVTLESYLVNLLFLFTVFFCFKQFLIWCICWSQFKINNFFGGTFLTMFFQNKNYCMFVYICIFDLFFWHCLLNYCNEMIIFFCLFRRLHKPHRPQKPNCHQ